MLITLCVVSSIISIAMLWRGHMPRRTGDTPFCRPCGYNLTGLTSDRCPECGRLMTDDNIVRGTRRRRPVLTSAGAVVLGVCTGLMIVHWLSLDWSRHKPTFWLMSDLQASKRVVAQRAFRELDRRFLAGRLSQAAQSRLIDLCLRQQVEASISPVYQELMTHLGSVYAAGLLSPNQQQLMFSQLARFEFRVRPKVVVGDQLPFEIICHARCPILPGNRSFDVTIQTLEAEIESGFRSSLFGSMTMGTTGGFIRCVTGSTIDTQSRPAGTHTLTVKARFSLPAGSIQGSASGDNVKPPLYQQNLSFNAPFELLSAELAGGLVRGVRDDAIKQNLKNLFRIERLEYKDRALHGVISVNVHEALWPRGPVPVAFDLIARVDGREIPLNATMARLLKPHTSHSSGFHSTHQLDLPPSATCDIILRGSEKAARQTIDLDEYWVGELIFTNLPIAGLDSGDSPPTSQPVGSVPGETRNDD